MENQAEATTRINWAACYDEVIKSLRPEIENTEQNSLTSDRFASEWVTVADHSSKLSPGQLLFPFMKNEEVYMYTHNNRTYKVNHINIEWKVSNAAYAAY